MPSKEAWNYIQTNGLLTYWGSSQQRQSPPFRTGGNQNYAAYPQRRTTPSGALYSNLSGLPPRVPYAAAPSGYAPNSYFNTPASSAESDRPRYVPRPRSSSNLGERSPSVKMPVEEPSAAPKVASNPAPANSTPKTTGTSPAPAAPSTADLPYGTAIPGRVNMVNSPFAGKTQLVDVSGMSAGQTVKCPYTGKLFKVPSAQQATNNVEPRQEAKVEAPQLTDEPKTGDKKP